MRHGADRLSLAGEQSQIVPYDDIAAQEATTIFKTLLQMPSCQGIL